jgi:site-specific recombinase XerD
MRSRWTGFQSALGTSLEAWLAHKRALGCRFRNEASTLRLLDQFLVEQHVETIDDITPAVIDACLASRPRAATRSYNQLLGIVTRLFDWLVARDVVPRSPVHAKPKRTTVSSPVPL